MLDDPEKIANASLYQRADLMEHVRQLEDSLNTVEISMRHLIGLLEEIEELVDGAVDITAKGGPNLAMQIKTILDRK